MILELTKMKIFRISAIDRIEGYYGPSGEFLGYVEGDSVYKLIEAAQKLGANALTEVTRPLVEYDCEQDKNIINEMYIGNAVRLDPAWLEIADGVQIGGHQHQLNPNDFQIYTDIQKSSN